MKKILRCPFCAAMTPGSDSRTEQADAFLQEDGGKYKIECVRCDARSSRLSDPREVIARWNRVAMAHSGLGAAQMRAMAAWMATLDDCGDPRQAGRNAIEAIGDAP